MAEFAEPEQPNKLKIELECDTAQALAGLAQVRAALERIAKLQAQTGLDGRVGLPVYETKGKGAVPRDLPAHAEVTPGTVREWFEQNGQKPKAKPRKRKSTSKTLAKRERKG